MSYPAPAVDARKEGTVQVEFTILDDGGIAEMRGLGVSAWAPIGARSDRPALAPAVLARQAKRVSYLSVMTYTLRYNLLQR